MADIGCAGWHIDTASYHRWLQKVEPVWRREVGEKSVDAPLLSIVLPTFNTPLPFLAEALESVITQSYVDWQLCVVDDCSSEASVKEVLDNYSRMDGRIEISFRQSNGGIAAASNDALCLARGEYVVFMDHDDVLPDYALEQVAGALADSPETQLLFSDSDRLDARGERCEPFFKPDWNYELFLAQNYLNHLSVYRRELLEQLGGLRPGFDGSQDYDLALRAVERLSPRQIVHVPRILYHWREHATSVSASGLRTAVLNGRRAVSEHLQRTGQPGTVRAAEQAIIYNRIRWALPQSAPRVGIVLFGADLPLLEESVREIQTLTHYPPHSIVNCLVRPGEEVNSLNSIIESLAVDLVLILHAGLLPHSPDWLRDLAGIAVRPGTGCVGVKCLDTEGAIANGPWLTGVSGSAGGGVLGMACGGAPAGSKGYHARLALDQGVTVVHGAAMMCRRDALIAHGGLDHSLSNALFWGADLSLGLRARGLGNVWAAQVVLQCSVPEAEAVFSAPVPEGDSLRFTHRWREELSLDTYYNPNLSAESGGFQLPEFY